MKTNNFQKITSNTLLLIFTLAIVMLPSVSSGMMKVNKDDRVLSITDERTSTTTTVSEPVKNIKVKTIIIKEIPKQQPQPQIIQQFQEDTAETTESSGSFNE